MALKPDYAEAHENRSWTLLRMGNLDAGWPEYEWRLIVRKDQQPPGAPDFLQPRWDGSRFERRSLLIHTEQGFGDTIQFIRYLPLVQAKGGKVLLACQAELRRLFRGFPARLCKKLQVLKNL